MIEKEYLFSPSELDYKAKKCPRCFYISKHYKINAGDSAVVRSSIFL